MKKLKLLLVAMMLSVSFLLAGCGSNPLDSAVQVNVGNEADYIEVTAQENSLLAAMNDPTKFAEIMPEVTGNSVTLKLSVDATVSIDGDEQAISVVALLTTSMSEETSSPEIGLAVKIKAAGQEAEMYLQDNTLYVSMTMEGQQMKIKLPLDDMMGGEGSEGSALEGFDFEAILEQIDLSTLAEKSTEDGSKYMLTLGDQKLFVILNNGKLSQVLVKLQDVNVTEYLALISPDMAEGVPAIIIKTAEIGMEISNSNISYPNFNEYQEMPGMM